MCLFISVAAPEAERAQLRAALPRDVRLDPQGNADLKALVHTGDRMFVLSTSGCGCHLFGETELEETEKTGRQTRAQRYSKKGWSSAKIQRALDQSDSAHRAELSFIGIRPDVREALAAVAARTACFHIFVHEYVGSVENARIVTNRQAAVALNDLRAGAVQIEQDQLYSVVA